jgi:hypothetical protein
VSWPALSAGTWPKLFALGFQRFQIKISHDASIMLTRLRAWGPGRVVNYGGWGLKGLKGLRRAKGESP